jgi:hypothetical protein
MAVLGDGVVGRKIAGTPGLSPSNDQSGVIR